MDFVKFADCLPPPKTPLSIITGKKKIILVGPAYPLRGGIANFNEALCRALQEAGHECFIVSFTLQYPSFLFPGKTQEATGDAAPEGIRVVPMINSLNPLSWFRTAAFIRRENPNQVIIRYWLPFMAPALGTIARLIKRSGSNILITALADNIIPHEKRTGDRSLTSYFVQACDSFVVMSQSVLDDLRTFTKSKPAILQYHPVYDIFGEPAGIAESRKKLGMDETGKWVLFFGFIRKYKGLDLLLRAFADERVKKLGIRLLVAGEFYEDKAFYTGLISELGLNDRILLHDHYIPKDEVRYYFSACNLVAQPYRDATQSGVTQIAYHFGKPMLVTDVGGLPEMVPDGVAGLVTSTDPTDIAGAIARFYELNMEEELTGGAKIKAMDFNWKRFVEALNHLG